MEKSVTYKASDLSPEERRAAEILLGQGIDENDMVTVRISKGKLLKTAATGQAREETFAQLFDRIDNTARRAEEVREEEIDAAIDEAAEHVRHNRG